MEERGTGIDGDLRGWAGETTGKAAAVTGDSLSPGKQHHWGPGERAVEGLHLKHMGGGNTYANKHDSAVHS